MDPNPDAAEFADFLSETCPNLVARLAIHPATQAIEEIMSRARHHNYDPRAVIKELYSRQDQESHSRAAPRRNGLSDISEWDPIKLAKAGMHVTIYKAGGAAPELRSWYAHIEELAFLAVSNALAILGTEKAGIAVGSAIEDLLQGDVDLMDVRSSFLRDQALVRGMADGLGFPEAKALARQAVDLYMKPDDLIAHYRHGFADPSTLTGNGLHVYAPEEGSDCYRVVSESPGRPDADGFLGVPRRSEEFWRRKELLQQLEYRGARGWYTNFLDSGFPYELPRFSYREGTDLISWSDRIRRGY